MDRIDIHVEVPWRDLQKVGQAEPSETIRERVTRSRGYQSARFEGTDIRCNARMSSRHVRRWCHIDHASEKLLETAVERLGLSARAFYRVLKDPDPEGQDLV